VSPDVTPAWLPARIIAVRGLDDADRRGVRLNLIGFFDAGAGAHVAGCGGTAAGFGSDARNLAPCRVMT
jgi:hypothetical protein